MVQQKCFLLSNTILSCINLVLWRLKTDFWCYIILQIKVPFLINWNLNSKILKNVFF